MTDQPEFELLIEIAKLLNKHSPEFSKSLAELLSSPKFIEHLVSVLSSTNTISSTGITQQIKPTPSNQSLKTPRSSLTKKAKISQKKESQSARGSLPASVSYPSFLKELEKTDLDKSVLLVKLYHSLMDKTLLPTLQDIRNFASDIGLSTIKATSRNKAIIHLVKDLLSLNIEQLKTKLDGLMPVLPQDDRSLEAWANIILDKERQTKQED
ncbi:hypothetical protein IQ276_002915 [Desmonostoc muscorum LEGE 12446]|uniref:Uncharacterized protein n=1 Tax=Desmonostoc muscorum LEGE 12446 TaxID=1828758 RepID=A0A8J7D4V9_DESMC|nr:hypothetical protein [Desmonostoc muscorum]MCF2145419.1 hypothetical protein [Desmonostoc muscorum LEGE 12446]